LKKEFTVAKDVHELQIQVKTFQNLLKLLTCHEGPSGHTGTIRCPTGVQETLHEDPGNVCYGAPIRAEVSLFLGPPDPKVPRADLEPEGGRGRGRTLRRFLTQKAETLLEEITDGVAPSIMLPASLSKPTNEKPSPKEPVGKAPTNKAREKEKDRTMEKQMPKGPVSNPNINQTWAIQVT
jgi:hypothetical protein